MDDAQKALDAARARRKRAVEGAFDTADKDHWMLKVKKYIATKLLSPSPGKTAMERLKGKTPLRPTGGVSGLKQSPSRAAKVTDSGGFHSTTCARRRGKTLSSLNEFVAWAGPIHLQGVACPPESDTKEHNDYKAKVCACARAPPVIVS